MRFNKIFAGPATNALPQTVEALANTNTIKGGHIVTLSGGEFVLAGAATRTQIFVAQENYLAGLGTDDAYLENETLVALVPLDELMFNARFAASAALTKGDAVALAANGLLQKLPATTGTYIVVGYADETVTLGSSGQDLIRVRFTQPRQFTVA